MKHWQYTDVPSVCQHCGYKTCSVPTYKRHMKHCSVLTTTSLETESAGTKSCSSVSSLVLDTNPLKCPHCDFSSCDKENLVFHTEHCRMKKTITDVMDGDCSDFDDGLQAVGDEMSVTNGSSEILEKKDGEFGKIGEKEFMTTDEEQCAKEISKLSSESKPEASGKKLNRKLPVTASKSQSSKSSPRANRRSVDKSSLSDETTPLRKSSQMSHEPKVLVVEGQALFCCMLCDFLSADEKETRNHIKSCTERAKKYYCPKCEFSCEDKLILVKHKLQHSVSESYQKTLYSCIECMYKTPLKKNFERHRACHGSNAAFKCEFCSYSSTGESAVRRHVSTYHSFGESPDDEAVKMLDLEDVEELQPVDDLSKSSSHLIRDSAKSPTKIKSKGSVKTSLADKTEKTSKQSSSTETKTSKAARKPHKDAKKQPTTSKMSNVDETNLPIKTPDGPSDDLLPCGDADPELHEKFEVDDITDIVWSCYYCKLDFKERSDMEAHTQAEHSINLKDCVMYSLEKGASDVSLFELEREEATNVLPAAPIVDDDEDDDGQVKCALCGFKGRRLSDLKRHFKLKHCRNTNTEKKSCKRPQENSTVVPNKKMKSVDSSMTAEGSTILAKLLQNDDPTSVYKPSSGSVLNSGSDISGDEIAENKTSFKSVNRKSSKDISSDDGKSVSEKKVLEISEFEDQKCSEDSSGSPDLSNSSDKYDKEVDYLASLMCNYCGYLGNNPAEVERHTKIHTGEKNYWCPCCDYKTIWKCDIKKHLEKFHSIELDPPDRLHQLLRRAFRPDGEHTAEELGLHEPQLKEKGERSSGNGLVGGLKKSILKLPLKPESKKDAIATECASEKSKKSVALPKVLQPKLTNHDGDREPSAEKPATESSSPVLAKDAAFSNPVSENFPFKQPVQKLPRRPTERYRPFQCSACGKRSNWKWDLKKHVVEQHPEAVIITLNKDEAQRTFAEMLRVHQEKLNLTGRGSNAKRLRIVTVNTPSENDGETLENSDVHNDVADVKPEAPPPQKLVSSSGKSILKGMVDLHKLKRFKCSGCIYRSNFRGDISRHIRSRHSSTRCGVIVMTASMAAASLKTYEHRWSMRKIDPSVIVDSNANASGDSQISVDAGNALVNHEDILDDTGKSIIKAKQIDANKRVFITGNGRKNDLEEGDTVRRREKNPQAEEDDLKYCTICPYVTEKSDVLKLHMSYHQPQARNGYSCPHCPYFVNTERLLHHHLQLHVSKESLVFQKPEVIHVPKPSTAFDSKYVCEICPYVSKLRSNYWAHRRNHFEKPNSPFKCSFCRFWTKDQRHLSRHTKLHEKSYFPQMHSSGEQRRDGDCCRCVFAEEKSDDRFRCGESLACPYCSYVIPSIKLLRQHMIFHVSFTDAVKSRFFHEKYDGADDYLFIRCKNQPLEVPTDEVMIKEDQVIMIEGYDCGDRLVQRVSSCSKLHKPAYDEFLGNCSSEVTFLPLGVNLQRPDDTISVHSVDPDLPELEKFSSGNSDISDRRASPVFIEAILMEDGMDYSNLPLDETVSVVELSENTTMPSSSDAISVVELSLRDFLFAGRMISSSDTNSKEPNEAEEEERLELTTGKPEGSEGMIADISTEFVPNPTDSVIVGDKEVVSVWTGLPKFDEDISEVMAAGTVNETDTLADSEAVNSSETHADDLPSLQDAQSLCVLLSKDTDSGNSLSTGTVKFDDEFDKTSTDEPKIEDNGYRNDETNSTSITVHNESNSLAKERLGLMLVETDNDTAEYVSDSNTLTPETEKINDVEDFVLGSQQISKSVDPDADSNLATDGEDEKRKNDSDGKTDVHSVFHTDKLKDSEQESKVSESDGAAVESCDLKAYYFGLLDLVKVNAM